MLMRFLFSLVNFLSNLSRVLLTLSLFQNSFFIWIVLVTMQTLLLRGHALRTRSQEILFSIVAKQFKVPSVYVVKSLLRALRHKGERLQRPIKLELCISLYLRLRIYLYLGFKFDVTEKIMAMNSGHQAPILWKKKKHWLYVYKTIRENPLWMRFLALQSSGKFDLCFVIHFLNLPFTFNLPSTSTNK